MQKHKSWGCSGKRDPTAYIKKNQLVTPSGVDHDFNFISGIEQSRDRKGEHLQGRSIQDAQSRSARLSQPAFRNRLQLARVNIEYAPLGMSRQKLNRTSFAKVRPISRMYTCYANTSCIESQNEFIGQSSGFTPMVPLPSALSLTTSRFKMPIDLSTSSGQVRCTRKESVTMK